MLEFYPPLPGSLSRQGESGPPIMGSAAPPMPFRPANDNNNAGKLDKVRFYRQAPRSAIIGLDNVLVREIGKIVTDTVQWR